MSIKSGEINYSQGAVYLDNLGKQKGSGRIQNFVTGIFETSYFNTWRLNPQFSGIMFWFCYGKVKGKGPERLYLAAEPKYEFTYPKADPVIARGLSPHQEEILVPIEVKGKLLNGNNGNSTLKDRDGLPNGSSDFENKADIMRKMYGFLGEEDFWELNKYGHGYFEAKNYDVDFFENLLGSVNDSPTYLRYYFGFDQNEEPSKLRIFMVPVDGSGNNITTLKNPRPKTSSKEPYLLQYSWPPPPKQQ